MTKIDSPQENIKEESQRAWYASPWFWGILLFLGILLILFWIFWHQWQNHLARLEKEKALLIEQETRNNSLQAEYARLQALLSKDPCELKALLGVETFPSLQTEQVVPESQSEKKLNNVENNQDIKPKPQTKAEAAPPPPPSTQDKSDIIKTLELATVLILAQSNSGVQIGTGFFIAPGIILTNQHVVGKIKSNLYVIGNFQNNITKAKIITISKQKKRDYAILEVPITNIKPLILNTHIQRTQKISTWGFPSAITDIDPKFKALISGANTKVPEVIYSEGTVSAIMEQNPSLIVHTAIVSQGNSGGPLVNEKGEVVGINTYIKLDKASYRQSSLSIVSKDIVNFLQEHSIPFTLALNSQE